MLLQPPPTQLHLAGNHTVVMCGFWCVDILQRSSALLMGFCLRALQLGGDAWTGGWPCGNRVSTAATPALALSSQHSGTLWFAFTLQSTTDKNLQPAHTCHTILSPRADDVEILDTDARGDAWATYSVTGLPSAAPTECREPVYCPELGLAMEAPRDGRLDIAALWGIA
jgi:hypothetical protein